MDHIKRRDSEMLFQCTEEIFDEQKIARRLVQKLNNTDRDDYLGVRKVLRELLPNSDPSFFLNPPFYCDYGTHIKLGKKCFFNFNCTFLDSAQITLGDRCMLGPNVSIFTAGHPLHPKIRNTGFQYGIPVTLGDNVWVGGNSVICPGVTIGSNVVIGAGSVVTKDIPDWSIAAGNPCKVIRKITDEDMKYYFKSRPIDEECMQDMLAHNFIYTPKSRV